MSRKTLSAPPQPSVTTIKVAVIQTAPRAGDPEGNLARVRDLVTLAVEEDRPDLIVLPERLRGRTDEPGLTERADGETWSALREMAQAAGCLVAGGFVAATGAGVTARYVIAEPSGATHVHDKDRPDPWEAREVGCGDGDNFALTPHGPTGIACGGEWARTITARRLRRRVGVVIGGAGLLSSDAHPRSAGRRHAHHAALARELAARMAQTTGAPVAIAVQADPPGVDRSGRLWRPTLVGRSRIVDRDGRELASVAEPGDGYACASVDLRSREDGAVDPIPEGTWLSPIPLSTRMAARVVGATNGRRYARQLRRYDLPWQDQAIPPQLPYNPPPAAGGGKPTTNESEPPAVPAPPRPSGAEPAQRTGRGKRESPEPSGVGGATRS